MGNSENKGRMRMKLEILVSWEAILCRDSFVRGDRAVEGSFVLLS